MRSGISIFPEKTLKAANIKVAEDMYYMKYILSKPLSKIERLKKKSNFKHKEDD
jgi:hypothetical protein